MRFGVLLLCTTFTAPLHAGEVTIVTDPVGAEVWVGLVRAGVTTAAGLRFSTPETGTVAVTIRKEGFAEVVRSVRSEPGAVTVQITLRPLEPQAVPSSSPSPTPVPLGEVARVTKTTHKAWEASPVYQLSGSAANVAPTIPDNVPTSLLDAMRKRAKEVLRPRMTAIAPTVRDFRTAWRHYRDACEGKVTATVTPTGPSPDAPASPSPSGDTLMTYQSESSWRAKWGQFTLTRNEDTPECRTIASDVVALADKLSDFLDGVDTELRTPPSVYPGIATEVFNGLKTELW